MRLTTWPTVAASSHPPAYRRHPPPAVVAATPPDDTRRGSLYATLRPLGSEGWSAGEHRPPAQRTRHPPSAPWTTRCVACRCVASTAYAPIAPPDAIAAVCRDAAPDVAAASRCVASRPVTCDHHRRGRSMSWCGLRPRPCCRSLRSALRHMAPSLRAAPSISRAAPRLSLVVPPRRPLPGVSSSAFRWSRCWSWPGCDTHGFLAPAVLRATLVKSRLARRTRTCTVYPAGPLIQETAPCALFDVLVSLPFFSSPPVVSTTGFRSEPISLSRVSQWTMAVGRSAGRVAACRVYCSWWLMLALGCCKTDCLLCRCFDRLDTSNSTRVNMVPSFSAC